MRVDLALEPCQSQLRVARRSAHPIAHPKRFPNPETIQAQRAWWQQLQVRDELPSPVL
jgi:hypothetical protein